MNHPPPAKMTYTEKAASLVPKPPLDGAQYESILANNIQRSDKEKKHTKENTTRLRPRKTPQHKSTKNQSEVPKFKDDLIKQHNNDTSPSMHCSRNN